MTIVVLVLLLVIDTVKSLGGPPQHLFVIFSCFKLIMYLHRFVASDCIYVLGGFDGEDNTVRLSTMEVYYPDIDQWLPAKPMPSPRR